MEEEKRDGDLFDFSSQILGHHQEPSGDKKKESVGTPYGNEVHSSYLLVNALINILMRKGIIFPHEISNLVEELHVEYMKNKKRGDDDGIV